MMRLKLGAGAVAFALAVLAGCTLDPHYERPAAPVAVAYPQGDAYESTGTAAAAAAKSASATAATSPLAVDTAWRSFFRDERLQRLIEIALANNRDLRVAALNVAEYEAQYRITRAALAPSISASGSLNSRADPRRDEQCQRSQRRHDVVGNRFLWTPSEPEASGAGKLPRNRCIAAKHTDQSDRDGGDRLSDLAVR